MLADTRGVWLSEHAHNRMKIELAELLAQRWKGEVAEEGPGSADLPEGDPRNDPARMHDWESRELRIRQLQELVRSAVVHEPPDDGVAEPGMVLTVHYEGDEDLTDTFLMAERKGADYDYGDLEICSPRSPLGMALVGAAQGEEREYDVPGGQRMKVTLEKAVPYGRRRAG